MSQELLQRSPGTVPDPKGRSTVTKGQLGGYASLLSSCGYSRLRTEPLGAEGTAKSVGAGTESVKENIRQEVTYPGTRRNTGLTRL